MGPTLIYLSHVQGGEKWGRYSIIGLPAKTIIKVVGNNVEVVTDDKTVSNEEVADPLGWIEDYKDQIKVPEIEGMPRFNGGLVGYFGYETIRYIEPKLAGTITEDDFVSGFTEEGFKQAVETTREYIKAGDAMQVVLSQRLSVPFEAPPIDLYRSLRSFNPSPYMHFMNLDSFQIVGSSPEILVRLDNGEITVRPIAGTRKRGHDKEKDLAMEKELLNDPKELAEHLMLIDLGRNDAGRVSQTGTVRLTNKMGIERYSHVMHIVSNVVGKLLPDMTAIDVLRATFPAGTVSGAPKIRAMEIIDELEALQYLGELGADVVVERNDQISVEEIEKLAPERIMISPGPCTPTEAGISLEVIEHFKGIFKGLPNPFKATRYHSLVIEKETIPDSLEVIAWTQNDDGSIDEIMGVRHKELAIEGSLVLVGYMFLKEGISFADALGSDPAVGIESLLANYALNGDAISVSEIPAAITGVALVILFILLRKNERDSIDVDVVIVGAGPAGLSTAIRLAQLAKDKGQELAITVLEKGAEAKLACIKMEQKHRLTDPGMELRAKLTIVAEGCRGSLSRVLIDHYDLAKDSAPPTYGIGIKEVWEVKPEKHQQGKTLHTIGWPLKSDTYGGSFLYHMDKNHVAVVTGARAITEGGLQSLPKLDFPGGLLIGDAAGFLNVAKIKGIHTAMKSGMLAAEATFEALTTESTEQVSYEAAFKASWMHEELHKIRNIRPGFSKGLLLGLANAGLTAYITRGKEPWTMTHHADHLQLKKKTEVEKIEYPAPDGKVTFDRLSSVYLSNTFHDENQPIHLKLKDQKVAIDTNLDLYDSPESRYCPAAVYEIVEEDDGSKALLINSQNCVHCKTCDIKDPTQNIVWTTPESGGPMYSNM
ncbi:Electron transfer flavoprotein-ubiquinone oxidoreductase [Nymphon striatum]|nr:Electron transfer flavoprotein-ubiquinone oxidoreductase [Nymphon striatum]